MKTLLVLSALASIALGAPTLNEDSFENTHHVPAWHIQVHPDIPESVKREKKSTSELTTGTHTGTTKTEVHNDGTSSFTGRTTASKKPLIVKKKFGYRLYRDSEEEKAHADSHESCGRQVKVKLCDEDGKFREMLRSSDHEVSSIHTSPDDMKLSIHMAKEAVENLQRDLMKMEHTNAAMKMSHDSETDTDLHNDIEVARQALEHIHTNFGDLETMSLHATASRNSDIHDMHITMAKSDEEKMAQWKEAMVNIQKNFEIARNIEDSFKSADQHDSQFHQDQFDSTSTNEHKLEDNDSHAMSNEHHMRAAETTHHDIETAQKEHSEDDLTDKVTIEHLSNNHARDEHHMEDDMNSAASEPMEMKAIDIENQYTLRSENLRHHEHTIKSVEPKLEKHEADTHDTEFHAAATIDSSSLTKHQPLYTTKQVEEQTGPKFEDKNIIFKSSENVADADKTSPADSITTLATGTVSENQRNTEEKEPDNKLDHHELHKNTLHEIENSNDIHAKFVKHVDDSAQHIDDNQNKNIHKETNMNTEMGKAAEKTWLEPENHHTESFEAKPKDAHTETGKHNKDHFSKSVQEIHLHKLGNVEKQVENSMREAEVNLQDHKHYKIDYNESDPDHVSTLNEMKSAEHPSLHLSTLKSDEHHLHHHLPTMKSAESHLHHHIASIKSAGSHLRPLESVPSNGHWAPEHRYLTSKEVSEDFHSKDFNGIDHMRNPHLAVHRYAPNDIGISHDYENAHHHQHSQHYAHAHDHERYHHHKMQDMNEMTDGAHHLNFHTNMREAMDGFGPEHTYRWAPNHEFRNAYGPNLGGSIGGSVGGSIGGSIGGSGGISGGAVGVFPNANTGGCGIPLLLSCSPSVVSGSLAKAHQGSYPGSSYRSDDDFVFHNKRDIKKTNEMRSSNVLRTPAIVKQKTGKKLDNQLL